MGTAPGLKPAAIVLAAGRGERFGGGKLLTPFHGRPLIRHLLDTLRGLPELRVLVVMGEGDDALARELSGEEAVFLPPGPQAASIAAGVRSAGEAPCYVILLADQPCIDAQAITSALDAWRGGAKCVLLDGGRGPQPPAVFDASLRDPLLAIQGDRGAKSVAMGMGDGLRVIRREGGAWMEDIDTKEDLERLERLTSRPKDMR